MTDDDRTPEQRHRDKLKADYNQAMQSLSVAQQNLDRCHRLIFAEAHRDEHVYSGLELVRQAQVHLRHARLILASKEREEP
jgi:hypothetical protein